MNALHKEEVFAARIRQKNTKELLVHLLDSHGRNVLKLGELFLLNNEVYCGGITHDDVLQAYRYHDAGKAFIDYIILKHGEEDELVDHYPGHSLKGRNCVKELITWNNYLALNFAHELIKRHHDFSTNGIINSLLNINASIRKLELDESEVHVLWYLFIRSLYYLKQADDVDASIFTIIAHPELASPLTLSRAGDDFFIIEVKSEGKNISMKISSNVVRKRSADLEYRTASLSPRKVESIGKRENVHIKVKPNKLSELIEESKEVYGVKVKVNFL